MKNAALFQGQARQVAYDTEHRRFLQRSLDGYAKARARTQGGFRDWEGARKAAASVKDSAIENLDRLLEDFADRLEARGVKICWAAHAGEARDYILDVAKRRQSRLIVKSKTMTTEEIHLNAALEEAGYDVVESDLGEYIVQLNNETPYHLVFPAMHLKRDEIGRLFSERLGVEKVTDPEALTLTARKILRDTFIKADIGISGANFGVAETGMISITENEGNARLTTSLPRVHIVLMGIEKLIPRLEDLALLLPMLATAGAGQLLTCYNSMIGGPRGPEECDGPEEMHVVLLDNQRTRLLADPEQREALRCIRCGACLNVCPIFRNIGGHSYGTTYQGPIGSVITPHLKGIKDWKHLSDASSLCGACTETCPVKIDLHRHLLQNRRNAVREESPFGERATHRLMAWVMSNPFRYRMAGRIARSLIRWTRPLQGTAVDPLGKWTRTRSLPVPPKESFREHWRRTRGGAGHRE